MVQAVQRTVEGVLMYSRPERRWPGGGGRRCCQGKAGYVVPQRSCGNEREERISRGS